MTPDQIRQIVEQALRDWHNFPWQTWLLTTIILGALAFFGSYLAERAKQRAIVKTLGHMTKIVEDVRSIYTAQLEDQRGRNQLRTAALDKRLAVHQEAYTLWRQLISNVHKREAITDSVLKCQDWYEHNCLYLSREAREAFLSSYGAAFGHIDLKKGGGREAVERNWEKIAYAGNVIVEAAALPPFNEASPLSEDAQKEPK